MLFETHQMMAEDLDYEEAIQALITEDALNAEAAVSDTASVCQQSCVNDLHWLSEASHFDGSRSHTKI